MKIFIAVSALAAIGTSAVLAHKGAQGIIKQRMMAMKSMGENMKELSLMVTGKRSFDSARTKDIAVTLKKACGRHSQAIPERQHARSYRSVARDLGQMGRV
ncbi:MAG: cytochrome c [Hyphomicrobiaceae bacterium]